MHISDTHSTLTSIHRLTLSLSLSHVWKEVWNLRTNFQIWRTKLQKIKQKPPPKKRFKSCFLFLIVTSYLLGFWRIFCAWKCCSLLIVTGAVCGASNFFHSAFIWHFLSCFLHTNTESWIQVSDSSKNVDLLLFYNKIWIIAVIFVWFSSWLCLFAKIRLPIFLRCYLLLFDWLLSWNLGWNHSQTGHFATDSHVS